MTGPELAAKIEALVLEARESGLSDARIIEELEEAIIAMKDGPS
jgi:hypothetical protein